MIRFTAIPPEQRQKRIMENLKSLSDGFKKDPYAKEFGIQVRGIMTQVTGRVLEPPVLGYKAGTNKSSSEISPIQAESL